MNSQGLMASDSATSHRGKVDLTPAEKLGFVRIRRAIEDAGEGALRVRVLPAAEIYGNERAR